MDDDNNAIYLNNYDKNGTNNLDNNTDDGEKYQCIRSSLIRSGTVVYLEVQDTFHHRNNVWLVSSFLSSHRLDISQNLLHVLTLPAGWIHQLFPNQTE